MFFRGGLWDCNIKAKNSLHWSWELWMTCTKLESCWAILCTMESQQYLPLEMTSHYFLDLGTPEPPKYCKCKPPIHPYEGDHVMMRLQGTLPFLLLIAQAQHTTLWAIFLSRWAECSLINLFLALHETLKSLPGVDSRPHIQYFCGPKKTQPKFKSMNPKSLKTQPPLYLPQQPGLSHICSLVDSTHFQPLLVFPWGDLPYFLVSSALHVERNIFKKYFVQHF